MDRFPIAVIIERRRLQNRWVDEAWEAVGVVPAFDDPEPAMRQIVAAADRDQFRVGGFAIELFRDEADNYFLNLGSSVPKVFVMWRMEAGIARPVTVTVSYGEAARLLDSGEQVDGVPMSREIADWVGAFVNLHYQPAPRRKIRRNDPLAADRERG
jgi:hypothetical protein